MTEIIANFQVTGRQEGTFDEPTQTTRVTVHKSFSGGTITFRHTETSATVTITTAD